MIAEWPTHDGYKGWNDKTIISADVANMQTFLLALTPTDNGWMRTDPVPIHPKGTAFAYGYNGGTPTTTYQSLLRCALGDESADLAWAPDLLMSGKSQLWNAITTTQGPLRLPWPQIQRWANDDLQGATAAAASPGQSR